MFIPKDLDTVRNAFKALDKAIWASVDGDQIVSLYKTFVDLKQLEDKIEKALKTPVDSKQEIKVEVESKVPTKKTKKGKSDALK